MLNRKLFAKLRVNVAQLTFFALLVYCFYIEPIHVAPLYQAMGIAGSIVALLGVLVRSLSAGFISKNDFLANTGLYALTRNPLYFGSFLIIVGLNMVIWNALFAAVTLLLFLVTYIPTIHDEEKRMERTFPEQWPEFKRNTPRFFPAIWRLSAYAQIEWNYSQWRRNREYQAVLTVILLLVLLQLYSSYNG